MHYDGLGTTALGPAVDLKEEDMGVNLVAGFGGKLVQNHPDVGCCAMHHIGHVLCSSNGVAEATVGFSEGLYDGLSVHEPVAMVGMMFSFFRWIFSCMDLAVCGKMLLCRAKLENRARLC